ncbi:alpha/beta hydrolase [Lactobacillus sp. CBA3606]|uniref:alpha/beta hydrolase n=1 Tax=Lactobacillus sp. CBA3606 TaxID=2099789 RepID=UPI000CFA8940|nr:alpha/beta hydrolase [Lactobacillus sp. CBA3606]AVK63806.1 alpha/beta hydrolase [Lactobacillus sp. CBA3606]
MGFNKLGLWGLVALSLLGLSGCGQPKKATGTTPAVATLKSPAYVPTLFFHGWGSSYRAEQHMARAALRAGVTQTVVRATVSKRGRVTLKGHFQANDHRPIVEVDYQDNRNANYQTDGRWARAVVVALQRRDHIKSFNMVGHSMGNMAIVYYLLANAQNQHLPKLRKQVDIAGHFNGILGVDDQPNRMQLTSSGQPLKMNHDYQALLALRKTYPKNQIKVLNIYGDQGDGSHSDGSVSNASSQSLKYLVAPRAKTYQEVKIKGPKAQHSKLHANQQVDRLLINFLWR